MTLSADHLESLLKASKPKYEQLCSILAQLPSALVAFSGGVDSAFLLKVAVLQHPLKVVALTAISPSVAEAEQADAAQLARQIGIEHLQVASFELNNPDYVANPTNRCYFCKTELYALCEKVRSERELAVILDGFNADDKKDHRPGHQAAIEKRVRSPLAEANLSKDEIRAWSFHLGLPTWDKPQMPCLASRLPYGTAVTSERLQKIGAAEAAVRSLGLRQFRVRYHGDLARLEVDVNEWPQFADAYFREAINKAIKAVGFRFVAIDVEAFRSGRLNDFIEAKALTQSVTSSLPLGMK